MAYSVGIPVWMTRLALVLLVLCFGIGVVPYLLLWMFVPSYDTPSDFYRRTGD